MIFWQQHVYSENQMKKMQNKYIQMLVEKLEIPCDPDDLKVFQDITECECSES